MSFLYWGMAHLKGAFLGNVKPFSIDLVQSGPYKFIRHPIYLSMLVSTIGLAFGMRSIWGMICTVVLFGSASILLARAEEKELATLHGSAWRDYVDSSCFFIPFILVKENVTMGKTITKKRAWIIGALFLLALIIGISQGVRLAPRMGYCFEAAFSPINQRVYLVGGYRGLHIFDISSEGELIPIATYHDKGYYRNIEILGEYAFIANSKLGLQVLDIHTDIPKIIWAQNDTKGYGLDIQDNYLFMVSFDEGLYVFDITSPGDPQIVSHFSDLEYAWDIWVQGDFAYIADFTVGLVVVDISDVSQPIRAGELSWHEGETVSEVIDGEGNFVYVAAGSQGLYIIDISNPREPKISSHLDPGPFGASEGVTAKNNTIYIAIHNDINFFKNGLYIYNVENPNHPHLLSISPLTDMVEDVTLSEKYLTVANTASGVVLFDIEAPEKPKILSAYPPAIWRFFTLLLGW
jgi:hypothetical protein